MVKLETYILTYFYVISSSGPGGAVESHETGEEGDKVSKHLLMCTIEGGGTRLSGRHEGYYVGFSDFYGCSTQHPTTKA